MFAEVLSLNLFNFFLVFARIGGAMMLLPGFAATYVPVMVRLIIALFISLLVLPVVGPGLPDPPASNAGVGLLFAGEALIGVFIGALATMIASALHATGTMISFTSAMANALVYDPVSQQQSALASGFLTTLAMVLLFVTDLHHVMLRAVIDSYVLFIPGQPPATGDAANMAARTVSDSFNLGIRLAAPFILLSFGFNLLLGLLARLMPQFPVFFVGLPLQQILSFSLMILVLSSIMMVYLNHFTEVMGGLVGP
ncbi:MAG: flagellar biosynthetic protein FliR [Magnetospiraceae bacterium]